VSELGNTNTGNAGDQPQQAGLDSSRLLITLGTVGILAGLLIVIVYQATAPRIQAYKAMKLEEAVSEVLGAPARWDTLYLVDIGGGALTLELPEGVEPSSLETIFLGYQEDGTPAGYAISGAEPGFQDIIELIFGYDARTGKVLGMKILQSKETPGLGDKIEDAAFTAEFEGPEVPLQGVKAARATGAPNEVDVVTGATISSRAVIGIINRRIERLEPFLVAYLTLTEAE